VSVVKLFGPTDRREFRPRVSGIGLAGFSAAAGGFAGAEPVGLGAGLEDVGVEGDPVDDRGDQAGSVEGLNRRISCIDRMYSSRCGRFAVSGSRPRSAHQAR
jgi:hypothetical protein